MIKAEDIIDIANDQFKSHNIMTIMTDGFSGMWRCKTPSKYLYSFTVTLTPDNYIAITGDVGNALLRYPATLLKVEDTVKWLDEIINEKSYSYLLEKFANVCKEAMMEFSYEEAQKELEYQFMSQELTEEEYQEIIEEWDGENAASFYESYYNATGDSEVPLCEIPSANFLWSIECLKLFVKLYKEKNEKQNDK